MTTLLQFDRPLVVFDLETTGTNTARDRIVEFAAVKISPDGGRNQLQLRLNPVAHARKLDHVWMVVGVLLLSARQVGFDFHKRALQLSLIRSDPGFLLQGFDFSGKPDYVRMLRAIDAA